MLGILLVGPQQELSRLLPCSPIWKASVFPILTSWSMTLYTMTLVGLLCRPSYLPTSPSLKVLLEKILQIMFDLSTCGVCLTPLLMTLSIFGCSNIHLLVKLLSGMLIRPHSLIPPLQLLPGIFYLISSSPFVMTLVPKYWILFVNRLWPAYLIMSRNGREERAYVEPLRFKDHVYMEWFLRSLLPTISKDVASHFP